MPKQNRKSKNTNKLIGAFLSEMTNDSDYSLWKVTKKLEKPIMHNSPLRKPDKPQNEISSYRNISLLPILSKLYEKFLFKRLKLLIEGITFRFIRKGHLDQI